LGSLQEFITSQNPTQVDLESMYKYIARWTVQTHNERKELEERQKEELSE
jgi:hypothetical protein